MLDLKEDIINETVLYVLREYPNKTIDDVVDSLNLLFDSVVDDLENDTDISSASFGTHKWHKGKYLGDQQDDNAIHTKFFNLLMDRSSIDVDKISKLRNVVSETITKSRDFHKKRFEVSDRDTFLSNIEGIAQNRHNYKPLTGSVEPKDLEIILDAANGVTPALSNEYNYRVDVVPNKYKNELFEQTKSYSQEAHRTGNLRYAVDENSQLLAPVLLCYSLRYEVNNPSIEQFCGPMTDRDPNMLNVGLNVWHTIMVAEALGYNTSFCQMTRRKRETCKEILGLDDPNDDIHSNYVLKRNGRLEFMPLIFVGIGSSGHINTNTRSHKKENIINTLTFK